MLSCYIPSFIQHSIMNEMSNVQQQNNLIFIPVLSIGFVTDGEFNSLRTKGAKRSLHLVQLIRDARESVSKKS